MSDTTPHKDALCIMLAKENLIAGFLLHKLLYWARYGKAAIPGCEGYWIAHERLWWTREARLSLGQFDRAISMLTNLGLIEKRQWWFGGRNILHVRPTSRTKDFVASAVTWEAADILIKEIFKSENPSVLLTTQSNDCHKHGTPSSANLENSNNVINNSNSFGVEDDKHTSAQAASPLCALEPESAKKNSGENETDNKFIHDSSKKVPTPKKVPSPKWHLKEGVLSLAALIKKWPLLVSDLCSNAKGHPELAPSDIGAMAKIIRDLEQMVDPKGPDDLRGRVVDIIAYALINLEIPTDNWGHPSINYIEAEIGEVVTEWNKAGRPAYMQK
jgi:hypothetical protein